MVNKTFEELGEYRDADGYIDFDRVLEENSSSVEREVRGNNEREKDWIDVKGGRVLVKTNAEGRCNAEYSELMACALAKQAGIEAAEYDMVKYKGETGLISKNFLQPGEEMVSLYDLVGNGPETPGFEDSIDIYHVFDTLDDKLQEQGLTDAEIDSCILNLRKQLLFDLAIMEGDRHLENISLIYSTVDGVKTVRLAPMYDTEMAFVLYNDPEYMKKIYTDMFKTADVIDRQEPRITIIPEEEMEEVLPMGLASFFAQLQAGVKQRPGEEFGSQSEEMWKKTFDFLCEDERVMEYWKDVVSSLDIKEAIKEVEAKTGVPLPEHIKEMATACFENRQMAMNYRIPGKEKELERENERKAEDIIS